VYSCNLFIFTTTQQKSPNFLCKGKHFRLCGP
jgi:hypothetical protein